jgi:disulfide bond formation protein DsbB
MTRICPRAVFAACACIAMAALATAYYLQHWSGMMPCPYCVLQRYAYLGVIALAALAWIDTRRAAWHGGAGVGVAVAGFALAVWQFTRGPSMNTCSVDPVGEWVNGFPLASAWPEVFLAEGSCADRALVGGVPLPLVSAGLFLALAAALAWASRASQLKGR